MTGPRVWMALLRLRRRQQACARLMEARRAATERYRHEAFQSPPMTDAERMEHELAVAAQRERDEARRVRG